MIKEMFFRLTPIDNYNLTRLSSHSKWSNTIYPCWLLSKFPYNSIYKILSKILSDRLIDVLPSPISFYQSVFLKGKIFASNSMIGLKLIEQIFASLSQNLFPKLDLSKVFDRIEWNLVTYLLWHMDFPEFFVQLIEKCITTTQIVIRFNQQETH